MAKSKKTAKRWGKTQQTYDLHIESIVEDYIAGTTMKDIGERYGVSGPTVKRWLKELGYVHDKTGRYPSAMKERAKTLYADKMEVTTIAKMLKVKPEVVMGWVGLQGRVPTTKRGGTAVGGAGSMARPQPVPLADLRHVRGKWWRPHHNQQVLYFLTTGTLRTVAEIYWATGASRRRQNKIWRETMGDSIPFPFPKKRRVSRAEEMIRSLQAQKKDAEIEKEVIIEVLERQAEALRQSDEMAELVAAAAIQDALEEIEDLDTRRLPPAPEGVPGPPPRRRGPTIDPGAISSKIDELAAQEADLEAERIKLERARRVLRAIKKMEPVEFSPDDAPPVQLVKDPTPTVTDADLMFGIQELERREKGGLPWKNPKSKGSKPTRKRGGKKKSAKRGSTKGEKHATKKSSTKKAAKKTTKRPSAKRK